MLLPEVERMDLQRHLADFAAHGFAQLGPVLAEAAAVELANCAEAMMSGDAAHPGVFYQHDSPTGQYEDLRFNAGWVGPSTRYRKLERVELAPPFAAWIQNALFERIARSVLGDDVRLYRCVLWNKAPQTGMAVPWHQDDGKFWGLDRPPVLQIWSALDDAPPQAGCLEVVPGSHQRGLASPEGGTVAEASLIASDLQSTLLPARRGECILIHNHVWHRTGGNRTCAPRRAVTVSFVSGDTQCLRRRRAPRQFKRLFAEP